MARKTNAARKPAAREVPPAPPAPAASPAAHPNGYAEREGRGAAPVLPIEGGGLATFSRIVGRPLEWLLPGLIPRDELVLCAGSSDTGKSTFFAAVMAHVSGGCGFWPGLPHPPSNCLLYSAEADPAGETLERLMAAGAHLDRCVAGDQLPGGSPAPRPYLPEKLAFLKSRVEACRASVLILDPLTSYLQSGFSILDGQHVRPLLLELQSMARQMRVTILFTLHMRKSRAGDVSDWVNGSKEWWNVPRHVLAFGRDPHKEGDLLLAVAKFQRGQRPSSRRFRIEDVDGVGRFRLQGESNLTARDIGAELEDAEDRSAREEAKEYLRLVLEEGERRQKDLFADATANGVKPRTLRRAAKDLGVTSHHLHVSGDVHWVWRKPQSWPD